MWSLHRVLLQCWQSSACSAAGKTRNGGILFDCLNQVHFREKIRWTHISAFWMTVRWFHAIWAIGNAGVSMAKPVLPNPGNGWSLHFSSKSTAADLAPHVFPAACGNEDVWLIIMAGLPHTYNDSITSRHGWSWMILDDHGWYWMIVPPAAR